MPSTSSTGSWHRDGSVVWVHDTVTPIRQDGTPVARQGLLIDVTPRRQAEEDLALANEHLREIDLGRSEFFTLASHEMRIPLTSMLGYLDILHRRWAELSDAGRREHVSTVRRQALRLTRLVRDLLAMTEMDQGLLTVEPQPIPLEGTVASVIRPLAHGDVTVEVHGRPLVMGDPERLEQIASNLVANALGYGRPPVRIEMRNGAYRGGPSDGPMGPASRTTSGTAPSSGSR